MKGFIKSKRTVNGVSSGEIKPYRGGRDVKYWGATGDLKVYQPVDFETFGNAEAKKFLDEPAEFPIAKSLNGKNLPIRALRKQFTKGQS